MSLDNANAHFIYYSLYWFGFKNTATITRSTSFKQATQTQWLRGKRPSVYVHTPYVISVKLAIKT